MNDVLVIFNPAAHSEKAMALLERIKTLAAKSVLRPTLGPGDARRIAADAVREGFRMVVAAGGDGTINEVVNGLAGSNVALGIFPVGTMNVFASELGLPSDLDRAWETVRVGHTREIDLAQANDQYFVQLAGVGFDAQIVAATSWQSKKSYGPLSYVISAAQVAAQTPPQLVATTSDRTRKGSFVLVGNGRYYGGPLAIFKGARLDDGRLDILVFKNVGYLDIVKYLATAVIGAHTDLEDVEYFQTDRVTVTSEEQVPVEVDGEVAGVLPVTFSISPHRLRVVVPG